MVSRISNTIKRNYPVLNSPAPAALPEATPADVHDELEWRSGYIVVVYDNDFNTFEQVVMILLVATSCTMEEAEIETWEVHHLGKSVVHSGGKQECERAASIIRRIGIRVEVVEE